MSLTPEFLWDCRGQKILVIEPFFYTPHVETGMELAEVLSEHNDVAYIGPDRLRCVTDETYRFSSRLLINCSRKRNVSSYLADSVRKYARAEIEELKGKLRVRDPSRFIDLNDPNFGDAMFENFDIGMGIRSSLLSLTRDTSVDPGDHADYALALARDAVFLYQMTKELLRAEAFDIVVLFNGRLAPVRAIRRACEASGTRYLVHERGSSSGKFAIFDCATPHQPAGYRQWADTWWHAVDDPVRNAADFLGKRRRGIATSWFSFTRKQVPNHCPPRSHRKRIAFFTSSEDELAAIGDELRTDSRFCDQAVAVRSVGSACRERGFEFVVRFHPNTPATATELMRTANEASQTVCGPSSEVDSYALIDSSDIVFTQNSTIGIEAASTGKPVYYTGRNIFEHCTSVRRIMTDGDLGQALDSFDDIDPNDALKYANFLGAHGIDHKHYKPHGIVSGTYRGRDLNAPLAMLRDLKLRLTRGGR